MKEEGHKILKQTIYYVMPVLTLLLYFQFLLLLSVNY